MTYDIYMIDTLTTLQELVYIKINVAAWYIIYNIENR